MKKLSYILVLCICYSCIPLQIAPDLTEGKIYKAKRFKRSLPKQHTYVFSDPKEADEFYYFISSKYNLNQEDSENNIAIMIDNRRYYVSFYETEKTTQTINLVPIMLDSALDSGDCEPFLDDLYTSRTGQWYIALTVTDPSLNDALNPEYRNSDKILSYVTKLQEEYLAAQNYKHLMPQKTTSTDK